jgi:hypothetical protein
LYIEQTRGVVQILLPAIPSLSVSSEYFVVITGGFVLRQCNSGDLALPLDARAERDKSSILYSLFQRSPKGGPIGIAFKVSTFPISFTCIYSNETRYSVRVIETDNLAKTIKSQSKPVEFVTPVLWQELPPKPTPTPNQIETFTINPDAICLPEGATVISVDGKSYTCKKSSIDGLYRWSL